MFIFKPLLSLGAVSLNQLLGQDIINTIVTLTVQAADNGNPLCTKPQEISVTFVDSRVRQVRETALYYCIYYCFRLLKYAKS